MSSRWKSTRIDFGLEADAGLLRQVVEALGDVDRLLPHVVDRLVAVLDHDAVGRRRGELHVQLCVDPALPARAAAPLSAREVFAQIKRASGQPWDPNPTDDRIIYGNRDAAITGIATCFTAGIEVLRSLLAHVAIGGLRAIPRGTAPGFHAATLHRLVRTLAAGVAAAGILATELLAIA